MNVLLLVALCGFAPISTADDDQAILPRPVGAPPERMLRDYLVGQANTALEARAATVAALKTPEEVAVRQRDLRAKFLAALGGLPERTPLNARTVGKAQRDDYRIEKVIYESRPAHHVTATLYLPSGEGPCPGVIMPIGHSENGKAADYVQRGAILLAKNGIACLAYDPIGQGERRQLLTPEGKPAISGSTLEHTSIGIGALLVGECAATYRVWDGIRSLDYLASRPEIDPKRLGCTGCSGGGTLTSYLMALDDRIVAAAPSCYLTTLERLFATIGPQDAEQNIPGQIALGINHADYIHMRASKPTLMLVATRDFFDLQGAWTTFREVKRVYGLLGLAERVEISESNTAHGYPREHREPMARWMSRWLLGKDEAITEPDFSIAADADLLCTTTGQVLTELKGKSCFDINREKAQALAAERSQARRTHDELRAEVRRRLALPETIPAARRMAVGEYPRDGYTLRKLAFEIERGIVVPGLEFEPARPKPGPLRIELDGDRRAADRASDESLMALARSGQRVLVLDLRGLGELAPGKPGSGWPGEFGVDTIEGFLSQHLNRPLLGQRVYDLLTIINEASPEGAGGCDLVAVGKPSLAALHAAALEPRIARVRLDRMVVSWTAVASTPRTRDQFANVVPGVLKAYDLPDLARLIAPRELALQGPIDPAGNPLALADAETSWLPARKAYESAGAPSKFTLGARP